MKSRIGLLAMLNMFVLVVGTVLTSEITKSIDNRLVNADGDAWEGTNVDAYIIFYSDGSFVLIGEVYRDTSWLMDGKIAVGTWHTEGNKLIMKHKFGHYEYAYPTTEPYSIEKGLLSYGSHPNPNRFQRGKDPMSFFDVASRPKKATEVARRGHKYLKNGDNGQGLANYDSARTEFTRAILLDDKNANAYYGRGRAFLRIGDNKQAIFDFSEAVRLNPKDAISMSNRGRAYARMGDYDQAIADFEEATKIDPKNELIRQNLERAQRHEDGL